MSFVQVQAHLSIDELLKAVDQLDQADLENFVKQALALRAQRQAPSVSQTEAELLQKINQKLPTNIQNRYDELIAKRKAEMLSTEEHNKLLQLTDYVENFEAQRIIALTELAELRQISLNTLMQQLNIPTLDYA
jgi:hypothetical protein